MKYGVVSISMDNGSASPDETDIQREQVHEIESLVTEWLHNAGVPGASVVIVDEAGERYAKGFGTRDIETNSPATPDTLYGMASIAKSVTSLAVLQLVEDGELSLDTYVNEYVDHFVDAPGDPITIGDLLSHTSGMPATEPDVVNQAFSGLPAGVADEADFERWVRDATVHRVTDEDRFFYYNVGYIVLGDVVEAVDGREYTDYVHEEIFASLGMDRSSFDPESLVADDDAMTGYAQGEDAPEAASFPFDSLIRPAGGLISSPRELARFLRAMMTDGSLNGTSVCSPETIERLQQGRSTTITYLDGARPEYGFGWVREPFQDDTLVYHNGRMIVSSAFAGFLDSAGLGIVVACNTVPSPPPDEIAKTILAVLTGNDATAVRGVALRKKCEAVTGTYELFRSRKTATVERQAGGITVEVFEPDGQNQLLAYPSSLDPDDHEFYFVSENGARMRIEFDLDGDRADMYIGRHRYRRKQPGE